jgi:hypothetical protein
MSGTRTRTFVFLTALVFCMASLLVGAYADTRDTAPSENTVINYPAYPLRGAPYIVASTYNPAGGGRIVLVFNEAVSAASTGNPVDDFVSTTMTVSQLAYGSDDGDNVLYLVPATTWAAANFDAGAIETLAMLPGALYDVDGNVNTDISTITIGDGPVITGVTIANRANDLNNAQTDPTLAPITTGPNNNVVSVTFDANVQFVSTDDAAFGATIEFNGQPLTSAGSGTPTFTLSRDPAATGNFLYMQPGVMNLRLAVNTIRWVSDAVNNAALTFRATSNDGPLLNAVYMNEDGPGAENDVMAVVFDQAVRGDFPITGVDNVLDTNGTWLLSGGTVGAWFSTDWTNVLKATGFSFLLAPGKQAFYTVSLNDPSLLTDYQFRNSQDANPADIFVHWGLGIVRAAYDNKLTPANYEDDQLYIYFSEPIDNPEDITPAHFTLEGFAYGDNPVVDYLPPPSPDQFPVVVITNFARIATPNPWEPGDRLIPTDPRLPNPDLTPLVGASSGLPLHDVPNAGTATDVRWVPVLDESRPCQLALTDTHETVSDAWTYDIPDDFYTLFLRFRETVTNGGTAGLEDADEYFLFPVRVQDEGLWDKTKMATYLGAATPIGNIRSRQIDDVTRLGIPISVTDPIVPGTPNPGHPANTLYQTVDGFDITSPGMLSFLLAAADWQGNVSRIETINPNEYGWTWLRPQPQNPNLRVYVQPEYCVGTGVGAGEVVLYGIHFIHDYEVDRVRFEWLKEEGTADQCDDDASETWEAIGTVGGAQFQTLRGDPLIYKGQTDDTTDGQDPDDLNSLYTTAGASNAFTYSDTTAWYSYYDADQDGIYSARDAVVDDRDKDDIYDEGYDELVIGSDGYIENIPDEGALKHFTTYDGYDNPLNDGYAGNDSSLNPAYFWADDDLLTGLTSSDYIFRENREGYVDNGDDLPAPSGLRGLNLWRIAWSPCTDPLHGEDDGGAIGYSGAYMVRCIAIDRSGNEDVIDQHCYEAIPPAGDPWNPNEIEPVTIDCSTVTIDLTTVDCYIPEYNTATDTWGWDIQTLDLDTTVPIVDQVPHNTRFIKIHAVPTGTDIIDVRFTLSLGGPAYNVGPNPDNDTYADLDGVVGFQYQSGYAPYLDDERISDVNGDFIFDAGDVVLDMGRNGAVDTPVGQLLIPLVGEDENTANPNPDIDGDHDGNYADDFGNADSQADTVSPYSAYFDLKDFQAVLATGTITATVSRERPACPAGLQFNTDSEQVEFNNWSRGLVDVIRTENEDNEVIDIWHPIADGDPYGIYGPDPTPSTPRTFLVHVTAEDSDGIEWVRLWYRKNPACGGTPTFWKMLDAADMDLSLPPWDEYPDETYPYSFHWKIGVLDDVDANYQFYAEAMDTAGNLTGIPVFPYGFGFNKYAGQELAHIVPLANADRCEDGPTVNVGEEYLLTAELDDPSLEGSVQVRFYYAPRIQGETYVTEDIDPVTKVLTLNQDILDPANGGLVVCVNGSEYSEANYTAVAGDDFVTFTTLPAAGAEIKVNYNFEYYPGGWVQIAQGDDVAPYTVEWQEGAPDPSGVPPFPITLTAPEDGKPAFDLAAVALIDVDGDGVYDPGSLCDLMEPISSENGNHIILLYLDRPCVHLYGLKYENLLWQYTQQQYWPGNPFGPSVAGNVEGKLSGKEADIFVTAEAANPAVIDSVRLSLYHEFHSEPYKYILMSKIAYGDEFTMPITMYTADYYEVRPEEIENVELRVYSWAGGAPAGSYPMTKDADGDYSAIATFEAGKSYRYEFFVDKIGDDFGTFSDRRNSGPRPVDGKVPAPAPVSLIVTPEGDFWYTHLTAADFQENTIYRAKAEAFDSNMMVGSNMSDGCKTPQGPVVFVYDTTPPNVSRFWADPSCVPGSGTPPTCTVWLEATDLPFTDVNVITTRTVVFQYSATETPDEWITFGIDHDYTDGWKAQMVWGGGAGQIPKPDVDNYDNDGDGEVDEPGEAVTEYPVRAVVFDDGGFFGDPSLASFPGSGNPTYTQDMTVHYDGIAPFTHITDPHDGTVYAFGAVIPITGLANDTPPEAAVPPGMKYARFQYKDGRTWWKDLDADGYYQSGVDAVFADKNGNGVYNAATDTVLWGSLADGAVGTSNWFDIDPTPVDSSDDPIIWAADPSQTEFTINFDTQQVWSTEDSYVHLRMLAMDTCGNETAQDPLHAEEIVIILDDATSPVAFLQWIGVTCDPHCRYLCGPEVESFHGDVTLFGSVMDPTHWDLSRVVAVDIEIRPEGGSTWEVLGRDEAPFDSAIPVDCAGGNKASVTKFFKLPWDTDWPWAEGVYELRAVAIDDDGNSNPTEALTVKVRIDRTPPVVSYAGAGFPGFVQSVENYYDDGTPGTSLVIKRDPDTGDVEFRCFTTDADVQAMTLQWRYLTDPMGTWRPWSEAFWETNDAGRTIFQDFQYEPAQNFGSNFVWVAHAEDFFYESSTNEADFLVKTSFVEGPIEWRVLATDTSCNSNNLQPDYVTAAVDLSCPTVCDYSVDKPTRKVVPLETMNFRVCVQDAITDVRHVTIQAYDTISEKTYVAGDADLLPVVEGTNVFDLDGPNTQWWFTASWAFPDIVYRDTPLEIYVVRTDPAGNSCRSKVDEITVQDLVAPDYTKIVLIAAETTYSDDSADGWTLDQNNLGRLQDNDNVWVNRDGAAGYTPFGGNPVHNDYLISEGAGHGVEPGTGWELGDEMATYPRWVDEGYMGNPGANKPKVARYVTLVSRTWVDDQSFGTGDDGVAKVTFLIRPVGGTAKVLGKDEYQPFYPLYLWHVVWNTLALATDGVTPLYPDGDYEIASYGVDLSGNVEGGVETAGVLNPANLGNLEWQRVTVDNTAPKTRMDADLNVAGFQDRPATDIQRNDFFTLYTVIEPESPLNDDAATFYIKRARDLNMAGSWLAIPAADDPCTPVNENWGYGSEDGNPDDTRPYSFDLNLTKAMDPVDYLHWQNDGTAPIPGPLHVGEEYDFVAAGSDLLDNTYSHIDAFADAVTKRSIRIKIVDTIAPVMTIVRAKRNIGDTEPINNPDKIYAQSFEYLAARNLPGDLDLDDVFFVYRMQGTTSWTLLDGTLSEETISSQKYWKIGPWDLRALTHNAWYEVAAIGVDDVGNQSDPNAATTPKVLVYVDFTAPDNYAFTKPAPGVTNLCDYYYGSPGPGKFFDLSVTDADAVENVDTWKVDFYYKLNSVVDTGLSAWTLVQGPSSTTIHDDATNTWSKRWNIAPMSTELYDVQAIIKDVAGNETVLKVQRLGYDNTDPTPLDITNIVAITPGAPAIVFHPTGLTDITAGIEIRVFASAKDDEIQLPEDRETAVATMQFYASIDDGDTWMDLGTVTPTTTAGDPTDYTASVDWNTTGIPVEVNPLWIGVTATDECGNTSSMVTYRCRLSDIEPPTARIIAFDPDLQPHGEDWPTCVKIYALAESDPDSISVIFQYDTVDGENDTEHEWVNIGVGQPLDGGESLTTEVLWWTSVRTDNLPTSYQNKYWLRALAKDENGNRYGDNPTDVVPTMLAELQTLYDGSITFKPIRTVTKEVEDVSIQVESPTNAILTIKMANSQDRPRVVVLGEQFYVEPDHICLENDYYWIYSANVLSDPDHEGSFGLVRSLDDPSVWRGQMTLDTNYVTGSSIGECLKFSINVTGADPGLMIDHVNVAMNEYPVTSELGTNGTVRTDGYGMTDANKVTVLSGAWNGPETCVLVSQTLAPSVDSDQSIYLQPVKKSAYHMELDKTNWDGHMFETGYHPVVVIKYDQAEADAAIAASGNGVTEDMLTVRRWGHDSYTGSQTQDLSWKWSGDGLSDIHVDTVNNTVTFRVDDLTNARCEYLPKADSSDDGPSYGCGKGNIFQLFAPKSSAPVFVFSVTPHSEYRSGWWTDPDPVFTAYLNDVGGQGIDPYTVQAKIDGNLVANFQGTGEAWWWWGNGSGHLWQANDEGTVYELDYEHSTLQRDWLPEGRHIFTIQFRTVRGTHELVSVDTEFWVDSTPPTVEFHGGWVSNPLLHNVAGYVGLDGCDQGQMNCMLTVKMTDSGSGIFVRPMRQEYLLDVDCDGEIDPEDLNADPVWFNNDYDENCYIPIDWGLKYDLWRVDGEDEQADIDEFEERELLHQGTADELLPYIQRMRGGVLIDGLAGYAPETDQLLVRLPIVGGGRIQDKDILEVTVYSEKIRTVLGEGPALGCDVIDTLIVNGEPTYILSSCWFDFLSQQRIIYTQGVVDQVRNSGSKYVEQRFIVDMTCPTVAFVQPGATLAPNGDLVIAFTITEDGVGVDPGHLSIKITGPDGAEIVHPEPTTGQHDGSIVIPAPEDGWPMGEYVIVVAAADRLGHVCPVTKTVRVENPMLTLTDAYSYPNPFDPANGDVALHFVLGKTSDVTIKIYDFAGNYVTTLISSQSMSGMTDIHWGGTAADGTKLANGAYIARVTANDGARTEEANLKVVIWRE